MSYLLNFLDDLAYVAAAVWMLMAAVCWDLVRTGVIPPAPIHERELLAWTVIDAAVIPLQVAGMLIYPDFPHAYFLVMGIATTYFFGRSWWKLHKDGRRSGRRRQRAKAAIKRLRDRLVVVPQPQPEM